MRPLISACHCKFSLCLYLCRMEKHKLQVVVRVRPQQTADNIWVRAVSDRCLHTTNHRNIDEMLEYECVVTLLVIVIIITSSDCTFFRGVNVL